MNEDSLEYIEQQRDYHYRKLNQNTASTWTMKDKSLHREHIYWHCRYLEKIKQDASDELELLAYPSLTRLTRELGED